MRTLRPWIPALLWAVVIWLLSTQEFSGFATGRWILPALHWLLPQADAKTLLIVHTFIRKSAHFVEYFIFASLLLRGIRRRQWGWKLRWGLATLSVAACYAALDELHQAFVPSRSASFYDTLIDIAGALAAVLLAWSSARRQTHRLERAAGAREAAPL